MSATQKLLENQGESDSETKIDIVTPKNLHEMSDTMMETLQSIWGAFVAHLPLIGFSILALMVTWGVSAVATKFVASVLRRSHTKNSLIQLAQRLTSLVIWILGLLVAAMIVFPGVTATSALGGLGILSIAIGFAFQDIFENFFAGILLLWRFPFERGDYIECQDIEGEVLDITIRMTQIRKPTDELILVPNSILFKNPVRVLTYKTKRRTSLMTGIAYDEDVETACKVIADAMKTCKTVDTAKEPQVFPDGFGSSSIDIEVSWWTDPKPYDIRKSRGEVVTAIKKALDNAGIEIPFPYRTLTFKGAMPIQQVKEETQS